jgi:hypothetical protein
MLVVVLVVEEHLQEQLVQQVQPAQQILVEVVEEALHQLGLAELEDLV